MYRSIAFLAAIAFQIPMAAEQPEVIARIVGIKGKVTLQRAGGKSEDAHYLTGLHTEDQVKTPAAGHAILLMLNSRIRVQVKPGVSVTVYKSGCKPESAVQIHTRLKTEMLGNLKGLRSLEYVDGATTKVFRSGEKMPPRVTPFQGAFVMTNRPSFSWQPMENAESYSLQVLKSTRDTVIWSAKTIEAMLASPPNEKPLKHGRKYRWRVHVNLKDGKHREVVTSHFLVAYKEEIEEVESVKKLADSSDPPDLILAAGTYEAYGAYGKVLEIYERLGLQQPEDPNIHALRAYCYLKAGRENEAREALKKAKDLGFEGNIHFED